MDEKELPHSVLAIEVFSVALPLALWSIFQPQFSPFGSCHADQPKADVPSITRFLTSPTDPGPVSSNNHDFPVGLISTIRLTNLVRSSPLCANQQSIENFASLVRMSDILHSQASGNYAVDI